MKKIFTALVMLFMLAIHIDAQITITASDLSNRLAVGKNYTTYMDENATTVNIGSIGISSWDFSNLVSTHAYVSTSKTVSTSTYANDFTGAGYASNSENTYKGTTSNSWVYNSVGAQYLLHGTGTNVASTNTTTKIKYSPAQIIYNLPLTYNSNNTQQTQQQVISTVKTQFGDFTTTQTNTVNRSYVVEAYGQMKMPGGKLLSCLRIKETTTTTPQQGSAATSTTYIFLTKTGESVSVSVKSGQPNTGVVQIDQVTWTSGDGVSETPTSVASDRIIPTEFTLSQNYPNPFNPSTKINFSIPTSEKVTLKIFDITGKEVTTIVNETLNAGSYTFEFNESNLSSGVYFYRLSVGRFNKTQKMILIK